MDAPKLQRTSEELRRELEAANNRLLSLKRRKRALVSDMNEQIHDQETEIEGILEQLSILDDKGGSQ